MTYKINLTNKKTQKKKKENPGIKIQNEQIMHILLLLQPEQPKRLKHYGPHKSWCRDYKEKERSFFQFQ